MGGRNSSSESEQTLGSLNIWCGRSDDRSHRISDMKIFASCDDDYQKIATATMNQKRAIELNKWFERARNDVYIEVDSEYDYCDILNKVN